MADLGESINLTSKKANRSFNLCVFMLYYSFMKEKKEKIDASETKNPRAVEDLFCRDLDLNGDREPLDENMMSVLLGLVLSDVGKIKEMLDSAKKITSTVSILESRAKSIGLVLDEKTTIFFGLVSGTPGIAVMYCYYLAYAFKKRGVDSMKFNDIMVEVFPEGLFTDLTMVQKWESQKIETDSQTVSDNLLDYPTASESITKK